MADANPDAELLLADIKEGLGEIEARLSPENGERVRCGIVASKA